MNSILVKIDGTVTQTRLLIKVLEPESLNGSLALQNNELILTTQSRVYTVTSKNGLIDVERAMRY